jgi:hypothetical protein
MFAQLDIDPKIGYWFLYSGSVEDAKAGHLEWCQSEFGVDRARWYEHKYNYWFRDPIDAMLFKMRWL